MQALGFHNSIHQGIAWSRRFTLISPTCELKSFVVCSFDKILVGFSTKSSKCAVEPPSNPMNVKNRSFMIEGKGILELSLKVKRSRD